MMGHINMLLLKMVRRDHGDAGVERLFELAGLPPTRFRPEVIYPEAEFQELYEAAKRLYGADDDAAQKAFADFFMEVSPAMFPAIFEHAGNARRMLESVPLIHRQWPSAACAKDFMPKVEILASNADRLVFKYRSPNRLCGVLRHVTEGVLRHYREPGRVTELRCARDGAEWCEVEVRFDSA